MGRHPWDRAQARGGFVWKGDPFVIKFVATLLYIFMCIVFSKLPLSRIIISESKIIKCQHQTRKQRHSGVRLAKPNSDKHMVRAWLPTYISCELSSIPSTLVFHSLPLLLHSRSSMRLLTLFTGLSRACDGGQFVSPCFLRHLSLLTVFPCEADVGSHNYDDRKLFGSSRCPFADDVRQVVIVLWSKLIFCHHVSTLIWVQGGSANGRLPLRRFMCCCSICEAGLLVAWQCRCLTNLRCCQNPACVGLSVGCRCLIVGGASEGHQLTLVDCVTVVIGGYAWSLYHAIYIKIMILKLKPR